MSETVPSAPTLTTSDYLSEPLRVGEPDVFGALAVYPVWGPAPRQPYVSFAQGREPAFRSRSSRPARRSTT